MYVIRPLWDILEWNNSLCSKTF